MFSRCRFCQHANLVGAKYCNQCGCALHLRPCERCDAVNAVDAKQCHHCGRELLHGSPSAAMDSTQSEFGSSVARALGSIKARLTGVPVPDLPNTANGLLKTSVDSSSISVDSPRASVGQPKIGVLIEAAQRAARRPRRFRSTLAMLSLAVVAALLYALQQEPRVASSVDGLASSTSVTAGRISIVAEEPRTIDEPQVKQVADNKRASSELQSATGNNERAPSDAPSASEQSGVTREVAATTPSQLRRGPHHTTRPPTPQHAAALASIRPSPPGLYAPASVSSAPSYRPPVSECTASMAALGLCSADTLAAGR
jgi:hypothetical protein